MIRRVILWLMFLSAPLCADTRPNILFLFADDLGRYASVYADPAKPSPNDIIKTPAFDRIAKEGALFMQAFVSSPSCTPCRGSVYTGRHFFRNGSSSQLHMPWDKSTGVPDPFDEVVGMPMTLAKAGYHIGFSYKWHTKPSLIGEKENRYQKHGSRFQGFSGYVSKQADKEKAKEEVYEEARGNFRDFLAKRQPGQPFFYSFNPTNTHRQWVRGSGKALWGLDPGQLKGKLPPFLPDNEVIREDVADYLGEAMAFDAGCGALIKMLEEMGELDNTLVVISGDHGIPGFPRGKTNVTDFGAGVLLAMRWPKGFDGGKCMDLPVSLVDLAPTFLAAAGLQSVDDPNGQDLLPFLKSDGSGGAGSAPRGWALIGKERHIDVGPEGFLPYPVRALRTADHLYVINFKPERWPAGQPNQVSKESAPTFDEVAKNTRACYGDMDASPTKAWLVEHRNDPELQEVMRLAWEKRPGEELYDLKKDPHQMVNLADDPAYAGIKSALRKQLMDELTANKDPRLDNDAFDRPPYLEKKRKP